ncbi:kit ligand a [Kryptolebias marmoratus]|uniref:Kit ligand n=1 Tax=Kryptolebias marmoratus TaxID=37003 RepID=A0A3Q2ZDI6_KRYMA|nr:kit ligand a [Kryptolebias marmoratus]
MKKSKSWIHVCVRFLLFITLWVHLATLEATDVTDDTKIILPALKQNIPKDYKIPVDYIPKEVAGMCWVKLNIYNLEKSLQDLADKFGNISSNKDNINLVIQYLHDVRIKIRNELELEMYEFQCHSRRERWETERYFDFVKNLYGAAHHQDFSYECDPPPCPSTPPTALDTPPSVSPAPSEPPASSSQSSLQTTKRCATDCPTSQGTLQGGDVFDTMKLILPSLMFVPLLALILLLVWKVKSRRNRQDHPQNPGEEELFTETEGGASPLKAETPETIILNVIETV